MISELLKKGHKIAFQFSGGKDSMACLYLLRPYLDGLTVYWVNAGDEFPETLSIMEKCREFIPNFVEIKSDSRAWRHENGTPSDLVPTFSSPLGRLLGFGNLKVSDRFGCCFQNLMRPMYERMKEDGITCVIRGQKKVDMPTIPIKSGGTMDGFEFFYPIENWSHDEVFEYLRSVGAPIHPCYEFGIYGANCSTCTAWWDESQHAFRRAKHPEIHAKVIPIMNALRAAIHTHTSDLEAISG